MSNNLRKTERPSAKRRFVLTAITVVILSLGHAALADVTLPITAVSFPKEVIPVGAGKIDFWAKLSDVSGAIDVGGREPYFFQIHDGTSTFHAGFNANDGSGNGGLTGLAGRSFTGTGGDGGWTYENIFGAGHVDEWHHYVFQWNKDGIPGVANGQQKVALFVDGVLNSGSWFERGPFVPLTGGTVNLITTGNPPPLPGEVAIDELKIYDRNNNLILWNTLGSAEEIAHSAIGLDGFFHGGGGAHFVPGISGNAVMARPVFAIGPAPASFLLTVTKAGTGTGTVTSTPPGITCGADCTQGYAPGTVVTLTAPAAAGSTFTGWSGPADCSDGAVRMNAAKTCTATFTLTATLKTLTVTKAGTGTGTVTSTPPGITCGADCTQGYAPGTVVTLTATPAVGSRLSGWSGAVDCGEGVVRMNAAKTCTATFTPAAPQTLTVTKAGTGGGTVTSTPAGITCGADCTEAYPYYTVVTLTATPAAGSVFTGWSGPADCSDGAVRMNAAKTCTATFAVEAVTLLVLDSEHNRVLRYRGTTGAFIDAFITSGSGGLSIAENLQVGPDGNLYISSWGTGSVKRYDRTTGAFLGDFVPPHSGGLNNPDQLDFGPDGHLYVSDRFAAAIRRYHGTTGAFLDTFVSDGRLGGFIAFTFGPDGHIYASMFNGLQCILRYNGETGAFMDVFACPPDASSASSGLAFGPDGHLYIGRYHLGEVWRLDETTGAFLGALHCPGDTRAGYLTFGPDDTLYVGTLDSHNVSRFDITSGACLGAFVHDDNISPTSVIFISSTPGNHAPIARADQAVTRENTAVDIAVLSNDTDVDGDPLTVTAVTSGAHGATAVTAAGTVRYTPASGFLGTDSFPYTVSDGHDGSASATVTIIVTSVSDVNWAQFHFDPLHNGLNTFETTIGLGNVSGLGVAWTATTGGGVSSSPAVVNGVVYVGSEDRHVYAFSAANGQFLWRSPTGAVIGSSPAVVNGVVYIGSYDGKLYAFDAATGALRWSAATGGLIHSSPAVVNGVVYVGSQDFKLYAFDAITGAVRWTAATGGAIYDVSPAVANGVVYTGSDDGKLYAFDAATGALRWSAATGGAIDRSSPAVAQGLVYVGSRDGRLYAFDAQTGLLRWSAPTGGLIDCSPAVANGIVYVGSYDGAIHAFNAGTGAPVWMAGTGDIVISPPAVANDIVYVGLVAPRRLNAYNATSGTLLWSGPVGGYIYSGPVIINGCVYVSSYDGKLQAFGLGDVPTCP